MHISDNGGSAMWVNQQHHLEHYTTSKRGDEGALVREMVLLECITHHQLY